MLSKYCQNGDAGVGGVKCHLLHFKSFLTNVILLDFEILKNMSAISMWLFGDESTALRKCNMSIEKSLSL
jgi:hypothetical protein